MSLENTTSPIEWTVLAYTNADGTEIFPCFQGTGSDRNKVMTLTGIVGYVATHLPNIGIIGEDDDEVEVANEQDASHVGLRWGDTPGSQMYAHLSYTGLAVVDEVNNYTTTTSKNGFSTQHSANNALSLTEIRPDEFKISSTSGSSSRVIDLDIDDGIRVLDGAGNTVTIISDGPSSGIALVKALDSGEEGVPSIPYVDDAATLTSERLSFVRDARAGTSGVGYDLKTNMSLTGFYISNRNATTKYVDLSNTAATFNVPVTNNGTTTLNGQTNAANVAVAGKLEADKLKTNILFLDSSFGTIYSLYQDTVNVLQEQNSRKVVYNATTSTIAVMIDSSHSVSIGAGEAKEFICYYSSGADHRWAKLGG